MMTVFEQWGLWGLRVLDIVWLFFAVFHVQCSGNCWSETDSGLQSSVSNICRRIGQYGYGVTMLLGVMVQLVMGASICQRAARAAAVAR